VSYVLPDPGPPNLEFEQPADRARLERVVPALEARGFRAEIADDGDHARTLALAEIPEGAEVHTSLSETLRQLASSARRRITSSAARPRSPKTASSWSVRGRGASWAPSRTPPGA